MKRSAFAILILILAASLISCSGSTAPTATPTVSASIKADASATVAAEGTIVPMPRTTLAFKTSGRVVEILVHEGDAVKAGATLARLDDAAIQAQVTQAQAALTVAQKQLAQLKAGATSAERQSAKQALDSARATLAKVKAGSTVDQLAQLKANVDSAQASVSQAQAQYDRAGGASNPYMGMMPESVVLQQATNSLRAAQAAYRDATSHPTESEIKAAESAVAQAESAVARLDPTPETLALTEAQVAQAQAALDFAKTSLRDYVLVAPFDGTVATLDLNLGQVVSPGAPVISFGDLKNMRVETVDLVEVDVAKISVGQSAKIKIDAFPDKIFNGKVMQISQFATDRRGDKVFKVTLDIAETTSVALRWGMTANVEIAVK
ncbi:MAG: efflux RND transporter periplasmic adaptor subunit [Chloroflexi bacterium]|nr:efflux RND transporter periplasmic adaptor subunit [Chloroflexota bacterium]